MMGLFAAIEDVYFVDREKWAGWACRATWRHQLSRVCNTKRWRHCSMPSPPNWWRHRATELRAAAFRDGAIAPSASTNVSLLLVVETSITKGRGQVLCKKMSGGQTNQFPVPKFLLVLCIYAAAGKAKAGVAHSACEWNAGYAVQVKLWYP